MGGFENHLVLLLNTRSCVSLVGIFLVVFFSWQWDKKWEQEGPENETDTTKEVDEPLKPKEKGAESNYEAMEGGGGDDDATPKVAEGDEAKSGSDWKETLEYPKDESSSKVPPVIKQALFGWALVALANIFPRKQWIGIEYGFLNLSCLVLLCCVGYLQSVAVPKSIVQRKFTAKKQVLNLATIAMMVVVGVFTFLQDLDGPVFASPLGSICIAVAPMLFWRSRLVGDTFDREGRVNPKPTLYNFGGPVLVLGWFFFWIGQNTSYFYPGDWTPYIHVYIGLRYFFSMLGAFCIICTTWLIGYGLDELENVSGQPETAEGLLEASAFGMEDFFCGYVYEIKVASILSWCAMGLAMFFPYIWGDWSDWIFLGTCVSVGYCTAMLQEDGFRALKAENLETWSKRAYAMLVVIVIIIPIQQGGHYMSILLSIMGAAGYAVGLNYLFLDQKRGKKWIASQQIQQPNVYSYGALLVPAGILILAWAVSMHPEV